MEGVGLVLLPGLSAATTWIKTETVRSRAVWGGGGLAFLGTAFLSTRVELGRSCSCPVRDGVAEPELHCPLRQVCPRAQPLVSAVRLITLHLPLCHSPRHSGSAKCALSPSGGQVLHLLGKISRAVATLRKPALSQNMQKPREAQEGHRVAEQGAFRGWDQKHGLLDRGVVKKVSKEMGHKSYAWKLRIEHGPGGEGRGGRAGGWGGPTQQTPT